MPSGDGGRGQRPVVVNEGAREASSAWCLETAADPYVGPPSAERRIVWQQIEKNTGDGITREAAISKIT